MHVVSGCQNHMHLGSYARIENGQEGCIQAFGLVYKNTQKWYGTAF